MYDYNPYLDGFQSDNPYLMPQPIAVPSAWQLQAQQQQQKPAPGAAVGQLGGQAAGIYTGSKLAGGASAALAGASPAAGAGEIASMGTQISAAAPSLSLGTEAPVSAAVPSSSFLSAAAPAAAVVAMPFIMNKLFGGKSTQRPFDANEIAADMPGKHSWLGDQVGGWKDADQSARVKLLGTLHDSGLLALPGTGKHDDAGNVVTKERSPEFVNWARFLQDPNDRNNRDSKWYDGHSSAVPTADDIQNAYWLNDSKKEQLRGALDAIRSLNKPKEGLLGLGASVIPY